MSATMLQVARHAGTVSARRRRVLLGIRCGATDQSGLGHGSVDRRHSHSPAERFVDHPVTESRRMASSGNRTLSESRHAPTKDECSQGARIAPRAEIGRQTWTGWGRVWDRTGRSRLDPEGRVRWHGCGDTDSRRDTIPSWARDRSLRRFLSSRRCDWHVEAHLCRVHVQDCALGLAGQGGTGWRRYRDRIGRACPRSTDHLPKRLGGRRGSRPALLGRRIPSHLR